MQIKLIAPRLLRHETELPASKSISNRALILQALAGGKYMPQHISDCDDTAVMLKALTDPGDPVDIKAAGTAMRFLTAYFAVKKGTRTLTGTTRMKQRPIGILADALKKLGTQIEYVENEGFPPLRITGGRHHGGRISLPGNVSSQYISALLMIGPVLDDGLELELTGEIISRPYIALTLHLMADFGAQAEWTDDRHIRVHPVPYRPTPYYIEGDWSAASYWYEMMALTPDQDARIVLHGLSPDSYQGDAAVVRLFEPLGVCTRFFRNTEGLDCVELTKHPGRAQRMDYDFVNQPDLAQTFVTTCAMLKMPFHFTGLQSLRIKETDRIAALIRELDKLGYSLETDGKAELRWDGKCGKSQPEAAIDTYEDHRMAMSFAPCCLVRPDIRINDPHVVSKSYPHYWDDLKKAGFEITMP